MVGGSSTGCMWCSGFAGSSVVARAAAGDNKTASEPVDRTQLQREVLRRSAFLVQHFADIPKSPAAGSKLSFMF